MMLKIKDSQLRHLDASPLTRLPGNLAIEQVLKGKMEEGEKFALSISTWMIPRHLMTNMDMQKAVILSK